MSQPKIGLLTGTFDPVHLGHVALARAAMSDCGLSAVWLLVNPDPSHKASVASYEHRVAMVQIAVRGEEGISVYQGNLAHQPHVIQTFEALVSQQPAEFVYIVGIDTFVRLDGWQDVQSVVANTSFAVAHRPGTPAGALDDLKSRLGAGLAQRLKVHQFEFDDHGLASSTQIRQEIAAGESSPSLDPVVAQYALRQGLYRPA